MKMKSAVKAHCADFKFVEYFGMTLKVPKDTVSISTDKNGFISFYQKSIPEIDLDFWLSETELEPYGYQLNCEIDDWKETLLILEK